MLKCKAMAEALLSSKNQIVVPKEARQALGLKSGDRLLIVVRGETAVLLRRPDDYQKAIRGIGKGIYPDDYLERERESWD